MATQTFTSADAAFLSPLLDCIVNKHKEVVMTEALAYRLLTIHLLEAQMHVKDIDTLNWAASEIMARAHKLEVSHPQRFTVGELRKRIQNLPDAMEVVIEVNENNKRNTKPALWEKIKISAVTYAGMEQEWKDKTELVDGQYCLPDYIDVTNAFSAMVTETKDGMRMFAIYTSY